MSFPRSGINYLRDLESGPCSQNSGWWSKHVPFGSQTSTSISHTLHHSISEFFLSSNPLPPPRYWGVVDGGCGFVSRPHPIHPFKTSHPTVYETSRTSPQKTPIDEILTDEKSVFTRWRGRLFIRLYENICVGFWKFPEVPDEGPPAVVPLIQTCKQAKKEP